MHALKIVARDDLKLATDLASSCAQDLIKIELKGFADTETVVQINHGYNLSGSTVVLVHQFHSFISDLPDAYSVNNELMKFLLGAHVLKSLQVKKVIGFLPYLAYSRQEGEGVEGSIALIGALCRAAGVDGIIASDIHSSAVGRKIGLPFYACDVVEFWAHIIRERILPYITKPLCIAAPDEGGITRARSVAELLQVDLVIMKKERLSADHAHVLRLEGNVAEKTIVIIDDILDTGRTAVSACDVLFEHGAAAVFGCFTHPVLSPGAAERLQESHFTRIFITDTLILQASDLPDKMTQVSANEFFAGVVPGSISKIK